MVRSRVIFEALTGSDDHKHTSGQHLGKPGRPFFSKSSESPSRGNLSGVILALLQASVDWPGGRSTGENGSGLVLTDRKMMVKRARKFLVRKPVNATSSLDAQQYQCPPFTYRSMMARQDAGVILENSQRYTAPIR